MLRLYDHIFKKYRIISCYNDTKYVPLAKGIIGWNAISATHRHNGKQLWVFSDSFHDVFYDIEHWHPWIERFCMVDTQDTAEHLIRSYKESLNDKGRI